MKKYKTVWHSNADGWKATIWREKKGGGKRRLIRTRPATFEEILTSR